MNDNIKALLESLNVYVDSSGRWVASRDIEKITNKMVEEFIDILEAEIILEHTRKSTAFNEFDRRWHEGKITHFTKLVQKTKEHFKDPAP